MMPPHPDRVRSNYYLMCSECLKNPVSLFASDTYLAINRTSLCFDCLMNKKYNAKIQLDRPSPR